MSRHFTCVLDFQMPEDEFEKALGVLARLGNMAPDLPWPGHIQVFANSTADQLMAGVAALIEQEQRRDLDWRNLGEGWE